MQHDPTRCSQTPFGLSDTARGRPINQLLWIILRVLGFRISVPASRGGAESYIATQWAIWSQSVAARRGFFSFRNNKRFPGIAHFGGNELSKVGSSRRDRRQYKSQLIRLILRLLPERTV
ncbi:hypothetical protein TcasGA2_TC008747 [Tribolium castaneum]|uniref:Uncharacterized protein n=1 Tax=Tribolium castaneum TaxID=7070 RepID=D6WS64_TRICA|nr:hypothetical protein TcasGA2_TC008747 [Tribolium castaneum]